MSMPSSLEAMTTITLPGKRGFTSVVEATGLKIDYPGVMVNLVSTWPVYSIWLFSQTLTQVLLWKHFVDVVKFSLSKGDKS